MDYLVTDWGSGPKYQDFMISNAFSDKLWGQLYEIIVYIAIS